MRALMAKAARDVAVAAFDLVELGEPVEHQCEPGPDDDFWVRRIEIDLIA